MTVQLGVCNMSYLSLGLQLVIIYFRLATVVNELLTMHSKLYRRADKTCLNKTIHLQAVHLHITACNMNYKMTQMNHWSNKPEIPQHTMHYTASQLVSDRSYGKLLINYQ